MVAGVRAAVAISLAVRIAWEALNRLNTDPCVTELIRCTERACCAAQLRVAAVYGARVTVITALLNLNTDPSAIAGDLAG